jgi:hypothetical protein
MEHTEVACAVVIETAGTMSVLRKSEGHPSALRQVLGVPDDARPSA